MKRSFFSTLGILTLAVMVVLPTMLSAAIYQAPLGITGIMASPGGDVYVRFTGLPNPSTTCGGNNWGWVVIPSTATASLKSLAEELYFNRRQVRVDTSGCSGPYEKVIALYAL